MITIKIANTQGFTEEEITRLLENLRGKVIEETEILDTSRLMTDERKCAGIVLDAYREKDGIYAEIKPSPTLKELIERSSEDTVSFSVRTRNHREPGL